jgi:CheY-like chemotaxis protein
MSLQGKSIFIVEDSAINQIVFQVILRPHGAKIEFERWPGNVLWRLQRLQNIDLIILDLRLFGGLSGYELFSVLRQLPRFERIPIVAVSAVEPRDGIAKAKALGFSGFISKPIREELFALQLTAILQGEQIWSDNNKLAIT